MRSVGHLSLLVAFTIFMGALMGHLALDDVMADGRPGYFSGIDGHGAAGHVEIRHPGQGAAVVVIHEADIDRVPDGRVYLTRGFDHRNGVELGKLTAFTGTLTFAVPASVNPTDYDSVVIWCKQFDVGIGKARLAETRHLK